MTPKTYRAKTHPHLAYPLGGIGSGGFCIEGGGGFNHMSIQHRPQLFNEPGMFAACHIAETGQTKVLEGPVPDWKIFGPEKGAGMFNGTGNGGHGKNYGLPRFSDSKAQARFPFIDLSLEDSEFPIRAEVSAWSPFVPGDSTLSCLPLAACEYKVSNTLAHPVTATFSFHLKNFLSTRSSKGNTRASRHGIIAYNTGSSEHPENEAYFCVSSPKLQPTRDLTWFRGVWFDALTLLWKNISSGTIPSTTKSPDTEPSEGASLYIPLKLHAGETTTIPILFSWRVPHSSLYYPKSRPWIKEQDSPQTYSPWYARQYRSIDELESYWVDEYDSIKQRTRAFTDAFQANTLPEPIGHAIDANLCILKSPTLLRQTDGRLWAWEGCSDTFGCCYGSCTHVWNYAQALCHLFPDLERSLRTTEFGENQGANGHQVFRANLPIDANVNHQSHSAVDGQLGTLIKLYRDWRISGDTHLLKSLWPKAQACMDYCIQTWDPKGKGVLVEPQHNTYDIEFWGPNGMGTSIYLTALLAFCKMGEALGADVSSYIELSGKAAISLSTELFNGEYFFQEVVWKGLASPEPIDFVPLSFAQEPSPEERVLLTREGPKYQYADGCLADGIIGGYFANTAGIKFPIDPEKVRSHLQSVFKYNYKSDLSDFANPQRGGYALGTEAGLLLCTWPRSTPPSLPFPYSDEVWTGIEYQVAAHMFSLGLTDPALQIIASCRARFDSGKRNPFNEYECGHWYGRALACYAMLQAITGIRYDAVEKVLYVEPNIPGDFTSFLSTESSFGIAGIRKGIPFYESSKGKLEYSEIRYTPCERS